MKRECNAHHGLCAAKAHAVLIRQGSSAISGIYNPVAGASGEIWRAQTRTKVKLYSVLRVIEVSLLFSNFFVIIEETEVFYRSSTPNMCKMAHP